MIREDIISMAREAGFEELFKDSHDWVCFTEEIERFFQAAFAAGAAAEREAFPNLTAVINWLENGCDPKEAAKELRLYAAAIRARGQA